MVFFAVLAALAIPAFASIITSRDDAVAAQDPTSAWTPAWTWYGSGKQCPPDVSKDCPCLTDSECGFQCPEQWPDTSCVWKAVFKNKNDWNGWKSGKYTPVTTGYVSKDTFELDCKKLCEAHDKCNSCQGKPDSASHSPAHGSFQRTRSRHKPNSSSVRCSKSTSTARRGRATALRRISIASITTPAAGAPSRRLLQCTSELV
ncbi:hypothetical protein IW261DRAFT_872392 [Armillaria novae-zelandiae]|uniref:Secreted protein n=1 Tax=Armillaria novae-zelandiae TaxID=153914 RepID=A0AA39UFG1_9AGAR|nr:hypothetical protein IW261DRAFT_872392 [Armillaria novae-zelandiae]